MTQVVTVSTRIGGVTAGPHTGVFFTDDPFRIVTFGAIFTSALADRDLRNPVVGTSGYFSSDVWDPTLTTTMVPPFDSVVEDDPGSISVTGGVITISTPDPAAGYGLYDLGDDYLDLYLSCEVFVRSPEFDGQSPDFFDVWDAALTDLVGLNFVSDSPGDPGVWTIDMTDVPEAGGGTPDLEPDTWVPISMRVTLGEVPPPEGEGYTISERFSF